MENNVTKEEELYKPMCVWLNKLLCDKYKNAKIIVEDTHKVQLYRVLEKYNVLKFYPQANGLDIEIDVLGIIILKNEVKLYFIEAKKTALNLQNLGQLWVYCKLIDPEAAFLLSSFGNGSLNRVVDAMKREDLLDYSSNKKIKKIQIAKWDINRNTIDQRTLIPKI